MRYNGSGMSVNLISQNKKPDMLNALTSFRFIAALLVFAWHTHIWGSVLDKYQFGYIGVGFFYILSGFILTYVYFFKLSKGGMKNVRKFYVARIAKIYPTHILTLVASLPIFIGSIQMLFPEHTKRHFLEFLGINVLLIQSYFPSSLIHFSFNQVAWSISVEIFFYAIFPVLIYLAGLYMRKFTVRHLILLILLLWLTLLIIVTPMHSEIDSWLLYVFPVARLPEFIVGILLGLIFIKQEQAQAGHALLKKHGTIFEIAVILALLIAIGFSPYIPQSLRYAVWLIPFWAMIVFIFSHQYGHLSRILSNKRLVYLGEISFSFYMIHQLVIRYINNLIVSKPIATVVSLLLAIMLSAAVYRYYEEPLRIKIKARLE